MVVVVVVVVVVLLLLLLLLLLTLSCASSDTLMRRTCTTHSRAAHAPHNHVNPAPALTPPLICVQVERTCAAS